MIAPGWTQDQSSMFKSRKGPAIDLIKGVCGRKDPEKGFYLTTLVLEVHIIHRAENKVIFT